MSMLTTARRALLTALSLIALLFSTIPPATAQSAVNGRNATAVDFGLGAVKQGEYRQSAPRQWVETNQKGQTTFRFEETNRDDWSVYLADRSRNVNIQLDLHTRKVMYSDAGSPKPRPLYDIYTARAEPAATATAKPAAPVLAPPTPSATAQPASPAPAPASPVAQQAAKPPSAAPQQVPGYRLTANAAILGNNLGEWTNVSAAECAAVCNKLFVCRSFDYNRVTRICNPSDKSAKTNELVCKGDGSICQPVDDPKTTAALKKDYPGHPYDHYHREKR